MCSSKYDLAVVEDQPRRVASLPLRLALASSVSAFSLLIMSHPSDASEAASAQAKESVKLGEACFNIAKELVELPLENPLLAPAAPVIGETAFYFAAASAVFVTYAVGAAVFDAVFDGDDDEVTVTATTQHSSELSLAHDRDEVPAIEVVLSNIKQVEIDVSTGDFVATTPINAAAPGTTIALIGRGFIEALVDPKSKTVDDVRFPVLFDTVYSSSLGIRQLGDGTEALFVPVPVVQPDRVRVRVLRGETISNSIPFEVQGITAVEPPVLGGLVGLDSFIDKADRFAAAMTEVDWVALGEVEAGIDGIRLTEARRIAAERTGELLARYETLLLDALEGLEDAELDPQVAGILDGIIEASLLEEGLEAALAVLGDGDEDGLPDIRDPDFCPQVNDPDLEDSDGDGIADECEELLLPPG